MDPEFLIDTTCGKCPKSGFSRGFTLSILFSQLWVLKAFFDNFRNLVVPMDDCHLLIVDNSDLVPLGNALKSICENFIGYFKSVRLYKTYRRGGICIKGGIHNRVCDTKLPPIILGYLDIARLTNTKILINMEDDTLIPQNGIIKLLEDYEKFGPKAFITGIESNRGDDIDQKTRLGLYYIKTNHNKFIERISLSPKCKGIVDIDASGHFFFITTKELFRTGFINMYQFLNKSGHMAPDTYHTYNLKSMGVRILADFDVRCLHLHPTPLRILKWDPSKAVSTLDYYIKEWDHWAMPTGLNVDIKKRPKWW